MAKRKRRLGFTTVLVLLSYNVLEQVQKSSLLCEIFE